MHFDAFLSYSRTADEALAPALRNALHKIAKPWYRRRSVHVFLDRSSLAANPALWPSIEQALRSSRYFILLCSPASAASKWVERELECWLESGSSAQLLLVLTDGELIWDERAANFDWERTDAISAMIGKRLTEEPLYVDMRWARHETSLSLQHPQFLDAVISLAAPIRGTEKEELAGEEVKQHRRMRRTAWAAGVSLVVLLVASFIFGITALQRGFALQDQLLVSELARLKAQNELGHRLNSEGNLGGSLVALTGALQGVSDLEQYSSKLVGAVRETELSLTRVLLGSGQIAKARFSYKPLDDSEKLALSSNGARLAAYKSQISTGYNPDNNKIEIFDTDGARKLSTVYVPDKELVSMMSFVDGARLLYVLPSKGVGMVVDTESGDIIASPPRRDVQWVAQKTARLFGYDRDSGMFTVVDLTTGAVIVTIDAPGDARLRRFSLTPKNEIAVILYSDGSLAMLAPSDAQERRLSADGGGRVLEFYGSLEGSNSILVSTGTDSVAILNAATSVIQPVDGVTSEQKPVLAAALPRGRVAYIEEQGSSYIRFQGGSTLEPTENSIEGQVESLVGTVVSEGVLVKDDTGEVYWVPEDRDRVEVLISGNADPLTSIAVSARSGLLVVGHQSGMIRVHRAPGMQETLELRGHTARVSVLSLSEGGAELVSASADGTVRHWLITTPAVQVVIGPHAWNNGDYEEMDFVTRRRMALAPDSRSIALRDDDHHVSIWSIAGEGTSPVRREDTGGTLDFGFTPDSGRVFIVNDKGELNIHQIDGTAIGQWGDVAPIIDLTTLDLFQSSDVSPLLAFDSTGSRLVTTSDTSGVYLWDLTSLASPTLLAEDLYKSDVGVRVRTRFVGSELTWRGDDDIQVWSLGAATPTRRVKLDESEQLMAVDAVSGRVATRNAGRVRISALGDGPAVELIDPPSVTHAWFSADGSRLLTANRVGIDFQGLTVWSAHEGRMLSQVGGEDGVAFSEVLLNRDGSRCLTRPAKNGPTDLWDMNTGSRIASLGPDFVEKIEFSPDGRRFFIASSLSNEGQGGVWLHDAVTGEAIWEEVSTIYDPGGVSFSPDGVYIIVYDRSNSPGIAFSPVLLVDAKLGELVSDLSSPVGRILDAAFDRAGRWLFGMRDDGTVVRWRTLSRPGEAQQLARAMVERWKLADKTRDE